MGTVQGEVQGKLGLGSQVCLYDAGMMPNLRLRDLVMATAEEKGAPYQVMVVERGTTDGRSIHLHARGVPTMHLSIPTRHIHSHAGIIHGQDYENALGLLVEMIKKLDERTVSQLA